MKYFKILFIFGILLVMPSMAFAGDHPEANFGVYGIQHFSRVSDYQNQYVGKVVKYLPNCMSNEGSYSDRENFIKAGGSFSKEYIISKITGNDKRMTFLLAEVNGKDKVKMVVNNQNEYYSFGKYTYCITETFSIPLFLVEKFNREKNSYVGKSYGNDSKLVISDLIIQKVEWSVGSSDKAYPKIAFEITDKSDGKKSYVDAAWVDNIKELGKEFSIPKYKCTYKVVGISSTSKLNYSTFKTELIKMYTVKNSISGITKDVTASSASYESFKDDDSGKFLATLSKVEKPSNAAVRYGNTTTITDKDITKFSYIDNFIDILIFASNSQFSFVLKNVSDNTLKIVWNEAVFVDVDGSTSKIMHSGIKYSQREADQPASTIIKGAKLDDIAAPTSNVYYSETLKEWTSYSLYKNADQKAEGQTIKLMLPIQVKDVINEYIFEFGLTYVYNHPEYLAD